MKNRLQRHFCLLLCVLLLCSAMGCGTPPVEPKNCYTVGFAQEALHVDTEHPDQYYVAGYVSGLHAAGVLDEQQVKAVVLDDNSGNGYLALVSIDCVAISSADVERIRQELKSFCRKTSCRGVHITATHDHAGADTLGMWGEQSVLDGKNAAFMEELREKTVAAVQNAYQNRTDGELYFGYADTADTRIQDDTRYPQVFDTNIYSLRFVPFESEKQTVRLINFASHAESLDESNAYISADFPAYVAKNLAEAENSAMVWFPGAIGGLIRTRFLQRDREENCMQTAEILTQKILSIDNEVRLEPKISYATQKFSVPCENPLFIALKFLGTLEQKAHVHGGQLLLDTEMSWLKIGNVQILLLPGEIFPELVYGGSPIAREAYPEKVLPALCSVFGDDLLVFGLTDDEIGYIVSPTNFVLHEKHPYTDRSRDVFGEDHYEETNSAGPLTAQCLYEAACRLQKKAQTAEKAGRPAA